MTDRELRKLSRADLLELLLQQTQECEQLRAQLDQANQALQDRRILLEESGSIAQAALQLNQVFQAAQAAADQYVENVQRACQENTRQQYAAAKARMAELERTTQARCAQLLEAAGRGDSHGA